MPKSLNMLFLIVFCVVIAGVLYVMLPVKSPAAFASSAQSQVQSISAINSPRPNSTEAIMDTATPSETPTPTVGYQATSEAAQSTAISAQAIANAAVGTANALAAGNSQATLTVLGMTATQDFWTANAPATPTPNATATAEKITADKLALQVYAAAMTTTKEAPTQTIIMANAKAWADKATERQNADIYFPYYAVLVLVVFIVVMALIFRVRPPDPKIITVEKDTSLTSVTPESFIPFTPNSTRIVIEDRHGVFTNAMAHDVPCTPEQLSELAERVINQNTAMIYSNFKGNGTLWTQDTFAAFRAWFQLNGYTDSAGGGQLVPNEKGKAFLRGWLNNSTLPFSINFSPSTSVPAEKVQYTRTSTDEKAGGGGLNGQNMQVSAEQT